MKSIHWISRSLLLLIIVSQHLSLVAQDKMALLMGVGDYPAASGWPSTNAYNDLNLIKETLIQQGLNKDAIYTFLDSACTKQGLQTALSSFLIPKLKEGMFIYIHYSGLAQQMATNGVDEEENQNVALVPFDASAKNAKSIYDPKSFLLNADLKNYFLEIRKKIGANGQLFVSFDASTAPAYLNGKIVSRGSDEKMGAANSEFTKEDYSTSFISLSNSIKEIAPIVSFYSSSFSKLNDEYFADDNESYGLFSYALCKSIFQLNKNANYRDWFKKLKAVMIENSSFQTPVMIGEEVIPVFNGQYKGRKQFFEIAKIYNKNLVLINGGKLDQIEKGTEILLYEENVKDTAGVKPIARGVIEDAKLMEADLRILESSINPLPRSSKILIASYHYKPLSIRVKVDLGGSELEDKLLINFAFSSFIKKDAIRPELLIALKNKDTLQLKTQLGEVLYQKALKEVNIKDIPFKLTEKIAEYLRANFLRNLEIDHYGTDSEIQGFQIQKGKLISLDELKNKVAVDSRIKLRITNRSDKAQYFNVIDIQPDNQINVLIPNEKRAEAYYLEAGQSYTTDFEIKVSPPIGKDVIKVVMMSTPLDLRPVINTRGVSNILDTKKAKNPFEIFMGQTFIEHPITHGEDLRINTSELGSVEGMMIEIVEGN